MAVFWTAVLAALGLRLAWVQVAAGAGLAEAAVAQRALAVPLSPSRGSILDRHGVSLSDSRTAYRVAVYPALLASEPARVEVLAGVLGFGATELLVRLGGGTLPVFVARGLDAGAAAAVMALGLPGVAVVADESRYGPGALARHVVGYVSGAHPDAPGGGRGADGLELAWDPFLQGSGPAFLALFVDGRGEPIPELGWRKLHRDGSSSPWATLPCDLVTTLDITVQAVVEEVMDRLVSRGAVVVLDPRTGDILAMASRPDFAPWAVASHLGREDGPLVNRAIAAYPPGSILKPMVLAAALEEGLVRPDETFVCTGAASLGGREFSCHARPAGGHGELSVQEALSVSCNSVFLELAGRLGQDRLAAWSDRFGLGRASGVGLPGESTAALPATAAEGPDPGAGLGLGRVTLTPLQAARAYAVFARGGRAAEPRLAAALVSPVGARAGLGRRTPGDEEAPGGARIISRFTAAAVTAGLVAAVRDGTGRGAGTVRDVAGKTGTVETGQATPDGRKLYHGWFAGYWPQYSPRLVITVLIEDTTVGGREAALVFGEILAGLTGGE
ncbi:MAG: penicillin-binding transpeptidase domain-containing protein [Bacillota bacterium]